MMLPLVLTASCAFSVAQGNIAPLNNNAADETNNVGQDVNGWWNDDHCIGREDRCEEMKAENKDFGLGRRRRMESLTSDFVCDESMDEAWSLRKELKKMIDDRDVGFEGGLTKAVKKIQNKCYVKARLAMETIGLLLQEDPDALKDFKFTWGVDPEDLQFPFDLVTSVMYMKQCLAYTEVALRNNQNALMWAWLSSAGSADERDRACGNLVNRVNSQMEAAPEEGISSTGIVSKYDVVVVREFNFARRLSRVETKYNLRNLFAQLVGATAPLGVLLAKACRIWSKAEELM